MEELDTLDKENQAWGDDIQYMTYLINNNLLPWGNTSENKFDSGVAVNAQECKRRAIILSREREARRK